MMGRLGHTVGEAGTSGAKPHNKRFAAVDRLSEIPEPPKELTERMKEDWRQICESMLTMGSLTKQSLHSIELAVYSLALARVAVSDKKVKFPAKMLAMNAARISQETLGLTPTAHAKIKPAPVGSGSVISNNEKDSIAESLLQ